MDFRWKWNTIWYGKVYENIPHEKNGATAISFFLAGAEIILIGLLFMKTKLFKTIYFSTMK